MYILKCHVYIKKTEKKRIKKRERERVLKRKNGEEKYFEKQKKHQEGTCSLI